MNRIVIVGGMGPQASLELHRRILASAAVAGAKDNDDYPEILHASIPIPDFISSGDSTEGLRRLLESLDELHIRHNDHVILACNTVHVLLPVIEARYDVRFTSLIEETVKVVQQKKTKLVGLLASPTTIHEGLYEQPLSQVGYKIVAPTQGDMDSLERAIRHIIANGSPGNVRQLVEPIIGRMHQAGADYVILGCTELSVMFSGDNSNSLIDPLDAVCNQLFPRVL
jgi:aspartate racemase